MTTQPPSDADLVAKARTGDQDAFAALVGRYQDRAYAAALGVLPDFDLARDVVQEAFLRAWVDLARLREPAKFGGWLYGIVRHMAQRARREVQQVRRLAERLAAEQGQPPAASPARAAEHAEQRAVVQRALAQLGARNREAVSLYYVDGLSYQQIAGFLGVTEVTVQGRLQRGRKELRSALAKELEMVSQTLNNEKPADDFAGRIRALLDQATQAGRERQAAIAALAELGTPAVEPLLQAIGDPRVAVRRAAALALCRIGDQRAVQPLFRALYAGDYWLGHPVFQSGQILLLPGVKQELLKILREDDRNHHFWALLALAHARNDAGAWDAEVWQELQRVYRDHSIYDGTRCQAVTTMVMLRPDQGPELAAEALRDPGIRRHSGWIWWEVYRRRWKLPIEVCVAAFDRSVSHNSRWMAGELALAHGQAGRQRLLELLASGTADQRASAALALVRHECPQAVPALIGELLHGHTDRKWRHKLTYALVRHHAAELLEWVREHPAQAARPALAEAIAQARIHTGTANQMDLVEHGVPSVRAAALTQLVGEQGAAALPRLRDILCQGRPRKLAQEAFWQVHRLREPALPMVRQMLESEHWTERKAAAALLKRWDLLTPELRQRLAADPHVAVRHAAGWHPDYAQAAQWHPKWKRRLGGG